MSTTVSAWADKEFQSTEKWTKDPVDKEENHLVVSALESLLNKQLSGSTTAIRINEILAPRLITGHRAGVGWLWGKLAESTRHFGATHTQQLVDLHIAIKQLPDIINNAGSVVTYGGKVIWRQMPDWGWILFEHGLDLDPTHEACYAEWHAQVPGHLSATIFTVTLMVQSEDFRTLASYANDAFDEILESFDDREMADEWKVYIPPAAAWIMLGGEVLHDLCFNQASETSESALFTPEKWQMWKDRLLALADQMDIDEHCQGLSREAAEDMERIEQKI